MAHDLGGRVPDQQSQCGDAGRVVEVIAKPRGAASARAAISGSRAHRNSLSRSCRMSERYAATDSLAPTAGLWRSASRAGTRTSAVMTHAISPISDAMPNPRIARFSLISSEP